MTITLDTSNVTGPHRSASVLQSGARLDASAPPPAAAIMLHGRGASADDIMDLARALDAPELAYFAPQANGHTWYPNRFLAPIDSNQPHLDSAHALVESLIAQLVAAGVPHHRIALIGFSQGACLAADHLARFPRRYGLLAACTGGLIGPPDTKFNFSGNLAGTPAFLGANDPDPHVPFTRVEETARVLIGMGAAVRLERYPGQPHAVNRDQIRVIREMLRTLINDDRASSTTGAHV